METQEENIQYVSVNDLKIGSFIIINDGACVILEKSVSKTGKHGCAKAHIVARNIFTDKKVECIHSTSEMVKVPIVSRVQYSLLDITDDGVVLLNEHMEEQVGIVKMEASEVCDKLMRLFKEGKQVVVSVIFALGNSRIVDCTEEKLEK